MFDRNASLFGKANPNLAGAPRAFPSRAAPLASDRDESKIPDRGADGARIAVEDHNRFTAFQRGEGVRQSNNAGANNCYVVDLRLQDTLPFAVLPRTRVRTVSPAIRKARLM